MKSAIVFTLCGVVLLWASGWLSEQSDDRLSEYERLTGGAGVSTAATVTDTYERTQRSRRSTTTTYCPVYTYEKERAGGEPVETTYIEREHCEAEPAGVVLGTEATVIYDPAPEGISAFSESAETLQALESESSRTGLLWWVGVAITAIGVLGIAFVIYAKVADRRDRA